MSESSEERDPLTPGELDPAELVGEPPAGDRDPTGFASGDQSADFAEATDPDRGDNGTSDDAGPAGSGDESSTTEEDA